MNSRKRQASRRKPKSKRVSRGKKVRSHRKYSGTSTKVAKSPTSQASRKVVVVKGR